MSVQQCCEVIRQLQGLCPWCDKKVPLSDVSLYQHVTGAQHERRLSEWFVEAANEIEADQWCCRLCRVKISANWSVAFQHARGARHCELAVRDLCEKFTKSTQQQVPPEVTSILCDGYCLRCRKPVGKHINVATEHVNGTAHKLFTTLQSIDWKTGIEQLEKKAEGLGFRLRGQPVNTQSKVVITLEVGVSQPVELLLTNNSKYSHLLRRILIIPPAKATTFGLKMPLLSQQMIPPDRHLCFYETLAAPGFDMLGRHEFLCAFGFAGNSLLLRTITISVVPRGGRGIADQQAAIEAKPYVPTAKRNPAAVHRLAEALDKSVIVPGERPSGEVAAETLYVRKLPFFDLPDPLPPHDSFLKTLQSALTPSSYLKRFTALIQLEEIQSLVDILEYDRREAFSTSSQRPGLLRLHVSGLAESRPSVQRGDAILASLQEINSRSRARGVFEGFVHMVEKEHVWLKFHADFHRAHIAGQMYYIRFKFNRIPLRRMLTGLRDVVQSGAHARFFLESSSSSSGVSSSSSSSPSNVRGSEPAVTMTMDLRESANWIRREVLDKRLNAVGLDTESAIVRGQPNVLAIIQIATETAVLIYRVYGSDCFPQVLVDLISDETIVKFSVGVEKTLIEMAECDGSDLPGAGDLSFVNLQDSYMGGRAAGNHLKSTQALADEFVPTMKFEKNKLLQTSNWAQWPLSDAQRIYAANDAIIALAIGETILARKNGRPAPSFQVVKSAPPASSSSSPPPQLSFTSKQLNEIQRNAVTKIIHGAYHPKPFLLFGPPGTGKTTVLVEAIQQLLKISTRIRILAVTPSNSAADLLVERLSNLGKDEIFRLNAISRSVSSTPEKVRLYSRTVGEQFVLIPREAILKHRVVVSTAVTASCLAGLGCQSGDFSHIVFDECGHATEPEALAAIGGLIDLVQTSLVLAGDPQQLGPIIRSPDAIKGKLDVSLLERLMQPFLEDAIPVNHPFISKLLHNYRSHPAILHVPNELFYRNELVAAADKADRESLCRWPDFPNSAFPFMFHHIVGKEQREQSSPSWMNLDECLLVCEHVMNLLDWKRSGLVARDIGIISPYHRQVTNIRSMLHGRFERAGRSDWKDLKVGSCEEFQGQERRVIIISTVRSQLLSFESFDVKFALGFVHQPKRLNVALTRAKQALIIVGNGEVLRTDPKWRRVLLWAHTNNAIRGALNMVPQVSLSSSSSTVGDDADLQKALSDLVSMRSDAAAASALEREEKAAAMEGPDEDGWLLVPHSDKPWRQDQ